MYESVTVVVHSSDAGTLLLPTDLVYAGAFRLPPDPANPDYGWEWGGNALTYYPEGDASGWRFGGEL
ncbi:MAG: hypothetical protein HYV35_06930 [Lentisphaerae bacterium]|nr:hypothetical protein [Lentisphaerota bacterium]